MPRFADRIAVFDKVRINTPINASRGTIAMVQFARWTVPDRCSRVYAEPLRRRRRCDHLRRRARCRADRAILAARLAFRGKRIVISVAEGERKNAARAIGKFLRLWPGSREMLRDEQDGSKNTRGTCNFGAESTAGNPDPALGRRNL